MTNQHKEPGFTFISNMCPDCESCISYAVCNALLKDSIYPKTTLRAIAKLRCEPMHDYLTYTFYDKHEGFQRDISYRRICIILDTWEGVEY